MSRKIPDPARNQDAYSWLDSRQAQTRVLQFITDHVGDGVTIIGDDGKFLLKNAAAQRIAGIGPLEVSPAEWSQTYGICLPDGATPFPEDQLPLARALRGESVDDVELFLRHPQAPDGTWVSVTARPLVDHTGRVQGGVAIYRDVTERKVSEQALRSSEKRYRVLFEQNLAGILRTTLDGRVLECNEAFAHMLGYRSSSEVVKLKVQEFYYHLEDRDTMLDRLKKEKWLAEYEMFLRRKDGEPAWILANLNLVERDDETGESSIIGTSFDITERKLSKEALRETQQRFAAFMRHLPGVAFMKNALGQYIFYNEGAEGLFHLDPEQFLGKTDDEIWPAEFAERFKANDLDVWQNKRLVETIEPVPHKNAIRYWLIYRFPILDENEQVQFIGGMGIDVTERKQLEEQLRQSQKMEAVGRLAGGVAHDFNNLLTVISGYGHMLLRGIPHDSSMQSCVEEVLKASSRAASLTNQLLAFSRRQVIQPKVLDLNVLVANMDRMLRRVIGEHIELKTALSPGLGRVKADAGQLEQVVMNLAVNAQDAMAEGGKLSILTANVDIAPGSRKKAEVPAGSYVRLTVTDTGKGIDPHTMLHLFEPFFTSKAKGRGTGLGLSTVYGIVKQSGGEVTVQSSPGRGATFNIFLPRIADTAEPVPMAEGQGIFRSGTETILLVEDESGVRQLVRDMLLHLGYRVLEAGNAQEAIGIFEKNEGAIDLLLTDVIMPQMSGRELAVRLKSVRPRLKVLYISGYTDDMLAHHGVLESDVFLLQKPFAPDALARKLREVLDAPGARTADA
ncbi:MAG: hybrid sensor histidine kinase/response regulator [Acidobacteria bacterium]|nr:MAG: hybrid sensor histidine kinase/response regulator [Acidobacteriota bacterium]